MSYNHNQYNYQIAVVFAIVIGGVLLLAGVVYAIYVVVVKGMRPDDKQRLNSGRNSAANWAPPQQQYREQPASAFPYNPAPSVQNYEFNAPVARTPVNATSYTPVPSVTPYNPQQYSSVPLATPTTQQYVVSQGIPQYQPDVIYTQGPQGYSQQVPVEYNVQRQSPGANFVQSSV